VGVAEADGSPLLDPARPFGGTRPDPLTGRPVGWADWLARAAAGEEERFEAIRRATMTGRPRGAGGVSSNWRNVWAARWPRASPAANPAARSTMKTHWTYSKRGKRPRVSAYMPRAKVVEEGGRYMLYVEGIDEPVEVRPA
jgi:hypothetical protein